MAEDDATDPTDAGLVRPSLAQVLADLSPTEVVDLRVEFDLVPEWSTVVEKIGNYYGEKVDVGFEGRDLIVKITIKKAMKERMMYDLGKTWEYFVDTQKRAGKWKRP
jgi:hypothetical protein